MTLKTTFFNRHLELLFEGKFSPLEISKGVELLKRKQAISMAENRELLGALIVSVEEQEALYKVELKNYFNSHLTAVCSCDQGAHGLCSHSYAALLLLDQEVLAVNFKSQKYLAYTRDRENRTSWPLDKLDAPLLFNQAVAQGFYEADLAHYHYRYLNIGENEIIGEVIPGFLRNHEKKRVVKVSLQNGLLQTVCNCGHQFGKLCKHHTVALLQLSKETLFPMVVVQEERERYIFEELVRYGLEGKIEPQDFAHFMVDENHHLLLKIYDSFNGLIPVSNESSDFTRLMRIATTETESTYLPPLTVTDSSEENEFALGYTLAFGTKGYALSLIPFTGKLNRARTTILTNITPYYNDSYAAVQESEVDDKLFILSQKLKTERAFEYLDTKQIDFNDEMSLIIGASRYQYSYLVEVFDLLSKGEYTYIITHCANLSNVSLNKSTLVQKEYSTKRAKFSLRVTEDENFIYLTPKIEIDKTDFNLNDEHITIVNHMVIGHRKQLYLIENLHQAFGLLEFADGKVFKMSVEHRNTFLAKYVVPLSNTYDVIFDGVESVEIESVKLNYLKPKLYISSAENFVTFKPVVEYEGGYELELFRKGNPISVVPNFVNIHQRDWDQEEKFLNFLSSLHPLFKRQFPESFYHLNMVEMMKDFWFHTAFELLSNEGVEVYGLNDLKKLKYSPHQATIRTNIASGIDWFEVKVTIAYGDNIVSLQEVKRAILKKERFVKLNDGTIGVLPEEWIGRFEKFFKVGESEEDKILISKRMFSAAEMLFDGLDYESIKEELWEKKRRLSSFTEIKKAEIPDAITATLMPYQHEGVNWLNFLDEFQWGGILADDMGLGKTVQTIVFLKMVSDRSSLPNLVVVPTSLIYNWENELKKFCPSLTALFFHGLDRGSDYESFSNYNIVVTTYGILLNEEENFQKIEFNYVVLDESQNIKNLASKRYKSVNRLKSKNRLAITGTPIENSTFDLFAQMNFVNPGFLGTPAYFRDYFSNGIDKEKSERIAGELQKIISPFILRRTKEQVALELPAKTEEVIYYTMGSEQRKVYDAFRNKFRDEIYLQIEKEGIEKARMHVLKGLICLRQICDSPALVNKIEDYGNDSVKIRELMSVISQKSGRHKILIFSQFVTMLHLIRTEIKELNIGFEYLDGSSTPRQREASVNNFQNNDECRIFLVSLKAGGTGLNLTAADYVYLVDPWWNPAVENQAIDRTHRIGQKKPVFAYRMICKDSVEERIIQHQLRKQKVANDVIYTGSSFVKELTKNDINDIFN